MSRYDDDDFDYCGGCCTKKGFIATWVIIGIVTALLIIIIVVVVSIQDVENDEIAIRYNTMTKSVHTDRIYGEGRYILEPTTTMFKYKRTLQNIDMTGDGVLRCLTQEGLDMDLDITTQYQIDADELFNIFRLHGKEEQYRSYLISVTRNAIKDVCPMFTGEDFFNRRGQIQEAFQTELMHAYNVSDAYATIEQVQVRNVNHPDAYEEANQAKESVSQERDRVLAQREQQITDANTQLAKAQLDADIILIQAGATAESNIIAANEQAKIEHTKWTELLGAWSNIFGQIGGTVEDFINNYVRYSVVSKEGSAIVSVK